MMNAAVKQLSTIDPPVSALQMILVRTGITYGCLLVCMIATGVEDPILGPEGVRMILVFRGISGFIGLFGVYFSLQYLSLSDATVLTFITPLCTTAAGAIFLQENFRLSQALAGVVSLVGVVLIARPPFLFKGNSISTDPPIPPIPAIDTFSDEGSAGMRLIAVGIALVGVLGTTSAYIIICAIGKRAHTLHIMGSYASQSVIVTALGMVITKTPFVVPSRLEWFSLLLVVGIFGFVSQVLLIMGLQREAAGRASMAVYTQIVFATIFQLIIFHTYPSRLSILGTVLILSSALYVAMTKEKTHIEKNGRVRLDTDDCDHLEAALHAPQSRLDNSSTGSS
ncbi:drug/metabolite transporter superfamily [Amanita muscaria]